MKKENQFKVLSIAQILCVVAVIFDSTLKFSAIILFSSTAILIYSLLLYFNVIKTQDDDNDRLQQTRSNLQSEQEK